MESAPQLPKYPKVGWKATPRTDSSYFLRCEVISWTQVRPSMFQRRREQSWPGGAQTVEIEGCTVRISLTECPRIWVHTVRHNISWNLCAVDSFSLWQCEVSALSRQYTRNHEICVPWTLLVCGSVKLVHYPDSTQEEVRASTGKYTQWYSRRL